MILWSSKLIYNYPYEALASPGKGSIHVLRDMPWLRKMFNLKYRVRMWRVRGGGASCACKQAENMSVNEFLGHRRSSAGWQFSDIEVAVYQGQNGAKIKLGAGEVWGSYEVLWCNKRMEGLYLCIYMMFRCLALFGHWFYLKIPVLGKTCSVGGVGAASKTIRYLQV